MQHEILTVALDIARQAGNKALQAFQCRHELSIETKGIQDWVTEADRSVEQFIKTSLHQVFPNHHFFGEESGGNLQSPCWVIDPIDGTTNFLYGIADYAISMAFVDEQGPAIGIICSPSHGRLIYAVRGQGAVENNEPLLPRVAHDEELLVGLNLNYQPGIAKQFLEHSRLITEHQHQIRVSGSAAWTLMQVACGELDGCYMGNVNIWDALAAQIICSEAGLQIAPYFDSTGPVYAFPHGSPLLKLLTE